MRNDNIKPAHVDSALIAKFLQNQSKELDIRASEIEMQKTSEHHSYEYSKIAIEKEAIDRNQQREFVRKCKRDTYVFVFLIVIAVALLIGYALQTGKDQIAMEIIKSVIFLLSGGAGGYALGSRQRSKDDENKT